MYLNNIKIQHIVNLECTQFECEMLCPSLSGDNNNNITSPRLKSRKTTESPYIHIHEQTYTRTQALIRL